MTSKSPHHRVFLTLLAVVLMSACTEDEDDCHARISPDFDEWAEIANKSGDRKSALAARESSVAATAIWIDDDRNVCDYVTAGPFLQRK